MFVPELYRPPSREWLYRIIRQYPLAVLVSNGTDAPHATHLPIVLPESASPAGPAEPRDVLLGHMNRSNPHWSQLTDGQHARLVFSGPGGYVTPTHYRTTPAAPTWDFVAVHVAGTVHLEQDPEQTLGVVSRTAQALEERFGRSWDQEPSLDHFASLVPGVGAFRLRIESVEGMFKLSQEKSLEIRQRVIRTFADSEVGSHRELARLMDELGLGRPLAGVSGAPSGCPA
ncbi:FMN-binding negative transcriptional regulator [Streptomyces sp. NBC_00096]|uniref:FMN-binding negative transcriptional regulator n=1 Tax=Streptomyces sp. NBC_00096 TaxID=2975650 RepID=UPI00324A3232